MTHYSDNSGAISPIWIILSLICFYSFIINILFGHRTYWRSLEGWYPERLLSSVNNITVVLSSYGKGKGCNNVTHYENKRISTHVCQKSRGFIRLDDNVVIYILTFLHPTDILQATLVSKRFKAVGESDFLWRQKCSEVEKKYGNNLALFSSSKLKSRTSIVQEKILFFYCCREYRAHLLKSTAGDNENMENITNRKCAVLLGHDVYELGEFLYHHPGGAAILLEWRGTDATRIFNLAGHSQHAHSVMKQYQVWSHVNIMGKDGWPANLL